MDTKQFTLVELEKMILDRGDKALQVLPDDMIAQHFPDYKDRCNFRREISEQDANALNRNMVDITKQLLAILKINPNAKSGQLSSEELEAMLIDHETYWNDRFGHGDIEAENANKLPNNIMWITIQLIEALKQ
ncbi:MAG: hypothetical protein A2076_01335 [Geobacteraceae bacterium GWC2_53_11]|nr:MAG: hypothetical protein A2076_01335 [Geobacteraceae bacterium GWC2_53_11]